VESGPIKAPTTKHQSPNTKHQTPNTKHQTPNTKHQAPSTREAPSSKFQARSAGRGLELGTWDFFGVWSLVFGVSIPGFLWSLVFGIGCFLLSPIAQSPSIAYQGTPLPGLGWGERKSFRQLKLRTPNTKYQRSSRSQAPNTREAPSSKFQLEARAAVWSLELGISLVFGAWFLVFRFPRLAFLPLLGK